MSEYFKNLSKTAKGRYEEKIKDIGDENVENGDPFLISSEWFDDVSKWQEVEFGQIYVFAWSIHPRDNESLQFPRCISAIFYGWVRTCYLLEVNNTLLLKAKVMRSRAPAQALTDTPDPMKHGVPLTSRMQQFSQGTVPVWQSEHSIYFTLTNQQWHNICIQQRNLFCLIELYSLDGTPQPILGSLSQGRGCMCPA